jgi:hypothetical protein
MPSTCGDIHERWASMTIDQIGPDLVGLAPDLALFAPGEGFDKHVYSPRTGNESFCTLELLNMRDEFTDHDGVNELFLAGLTAPSLNAGNRWP